MLFVEGLNQKKHIPFKVFSSWWFQPLWKICSSKWKSSPNKGDNKKYLKPPPRKCFGPEKNPWNKQAPSIRKPFKHGHFENPQKTPTWFLFTFPLEGPRILIGKKTLLKHVETKNKTNNFTTSTCLQPLQVFTTSTCLNPGPLCFFFLSETEPPPKKKHTPPQNLSSQTNEFHFWSCSLRLGGVLLKARSHLSNEKWAPGCFGSLYMGYTTQLFLGIIMHQL